MTKIGMSEEPLRPIDVKQGFETERELRRPNRSKYDEIRQELDTYYKMLQRFSDADPERIFWDLSGMSGRLCELRAQLQRADDRVAQALRSREVDPLIEEIDRQFRFFSRIQTVRSQEWEISKGGT